MLLLFSVVLIEFCLLKKGASDFLQPNYERNYDEMFNHHINADNIVLGSSHATHGINPEYLLPQGRWYNFALNGANPSFTLAWYRDIFSQYYRKPKLIVFEVNWFIFDSKWLWRKTYQDFRFFPAAAFTQFFLRKGMTYGIEMLKSKFRIFDGGKTLCYRMLTAGNPDGDLTFTMGNNGFVALESNRLKETPEDIKSIQDPSQVDDFIGLIQLINASGAQLVFVQAPEYIPGRNSSQIKEGNALLSNISKWHHVPFFNYNDQKISKINYDKRLYYDWGHLNEKGSAQFTEILNKDLQTVIPFLQEDLKRVDSSPKN